MMNVILNSVGRIHLCELSVDVMSSSKLSSAPRTLTLMESYELTAPHLSAGLSA